MRDEKKQLRHDAITQAAYSLLATKGYDGASMLSIAKAASASNETLYRWYGDKRGLFQAMVSDNAENIKNILEQAVEGQDDPSETLTLIAPLLLTMLLGERAISLNRAAAADPTGALGAAIAAGGRSVIQPLIAKLITMLSAKQDADVQELTDLFLGLLIGDLQIRRAIGALPVPTKSEIQDRSDMALRAFFRLLKEC